MSRLPAAIITSPLAMSVFIARKLPWRLHGRRDLYLVLPNACCQKSEASFARPTMMT